MSSAEGSSARKSPEVADIPPNIPRVRSPLRTRSRPSPQPTFTLRSQRKFILTDLEIDQDFRLEPGKRGNPRLGAYFQARVPSNDESASRRNEPVDFGIPIFLSSQISVEKIDAYSENVRQIAREDYSDKVLQLALDILAQSKYDTDAALQMFASIPKSEYNPAWSPKEKEIFEENYTKFGKRFAMFANLPGKTRAQIVEYYYFWKKTYHHDNFVRERFTHHKVLEGENPSGSHKFLQVNRKGKNRPGPSSSEKPKSKGPAELDLIEGGCSSCNVPDSYRWRRGPRGSKLCNGCYVKWLRAGRQDILPCNMPGFRKKNATRKAENSNHSSAAVQELADAASNFDERHEPKQSRKEISPPSILAPENDQPNSPVSEPLFTPAPAPTLAAPSAPAPAPAPEEHKRKLEVPLIPPVVPDIVSGKREPEVLLFNSGLLSVPFLPTAKRQRRIAPKIDSPVSSPASVSVTAPTPTPKLPLPRLSQGNVLNLLHGKRTQHGRQTEIPEKFKRLMDHLGLAEPGN